MESKPLFKVGSVYHNGWQDGPYRLLPSGDGCAKLLNVRTNRALASDWRLSDGRWTLGNEAFTNMHLIPGELALKDGEWVPVEEEAKPLPRAQHVCTVPVGRVVSPADLRMIARDGVPKAKPTPIPAAPVSTSKPALSGLTTVRSVDHRFGLGK